MEGDFNIKGKTYAYMAQGKERPDFGALRPKAFDLFLKIQTSVSQNLIQVSESQRGYLNDIFSCTQRLSSFLYHSNRFTFHIKSLNSIAPPKNQLIYSAIDEACIDFESLLFLGRAALDRLAYFVASRVYEQKNADKFSNLQNVLQNFIEKDDRAENADAIISKSNPAFEGLITDSAETQALRSALIHRRSIGEVTTYGFTVHGLPDGRLLFFDCEIGNKPLIGSAEYLFKHVNFVSLNLLSIYGDFDAQVNINDCSPLWDHNIVHYSSYIDSSNSGPKFSIIRAHPDGFRILTNHLRAEVLDHSVERQITSP